jgi:hypothetical protein
VKAEPLQYPWRQSFYKKRLSKTDPSLISPEWAKLAGDKKYAAVAHDLALGAAKEHPLVYLRMIFLKIGMATMSQPAERMIEPAQFWEFQKIWNEDRWADPSRQSEMRLMYGRDHEAYEAMQSERSGRASLIAAPLERSGKWLAWFAPGRDDVTHELYLRVLWFGALVLLGLFWAVLPAEFSSTRALLLPAFLYLLTVYAVGDALARYALPVEWIGIVLAVLGLDRTLQFVLPLFSRTRESAAPAVVGAGAGA